VSTPDHEGPVDRWIAADLTIAVLPADRAFVAESRAVRELVASLATSGAGDDLLDACAVLGGLLAAHGGSPTLASATLDHAVEALGSAAPPWSKAARAAVAEGFARVVLEGARREAVKAWEYPHCAVPIEGDAIAVTAAYPSDDAELVAAWAARVAKGAALGGIRRAVVSGREALAVVDAMAIVGIRTVVT
jgi:hypothetical protein